MDPYKYDAFHSALKLHLESLLPLLYAKNAGCNPMVFRYARERGIVEV